MDKPKLIIDTNVFYSLNGYKKNDKITDSIAKEITNDYQLFISSASLYEMISRVYNYEKDKRLFKISEQMKYLRKHNIRIIPSNFFPITFDDSNNFINKCYSLNKIMNFIEIKHNSEAEMSVGILLQIVWYYLFALSSIVYNTKSNENQQRKHSVLTRNLLNDNFKPLNEFFKTCLTIGTLNNDSDKVFEEYFEKFQKALIDIWFKDFYRAKYCVDNKISVEEIIKEDLPVNYLDNAKLNDVLWNEIESQDNLASYFRKKGNPNIFKNYLNEFEDEMGKEDILPKETILFLKNYFKTNLEKGKKVRKNDIDDIVIYSSKYKKDYQMLTLDKNFIKLMKDVDIDSYNLNMEFKFI